MNSVDILKKYLEYKTDQSQDFAPASSKNDRVLFLDGMNLYLRAFSVSTTMDDDGNHIGGITGFLMSIGKAIRDLKPSRVVVVFDGRGGSYKRRALFPDYKSGRKSMTRLNRVHDFEDIEAEKKSIERQLKLTVAVLTHLPVTILSIDNVEADDVIAHLAQTVEVRGGKSIIMSMDKDFLQLVNSNITVWHPQLKKMFTPLDIVEKYGFHPNNFIIYRIITGDSSDSIPGVYGIKEKTLLKFFPELATEEGRSPEYILETAAKKKEEMKKKTPVALNTLVESKEVLDRNMQLMKLDGRAMTGDLRIQIIEKFDMEIPKLEKYILTKLMYEAKLLSAFGNWDKWVVDTFLPLTRFCIHD